MAKIVLTEPKMKICLAPFRVCIRACGAKAGNRGLIGETELALMNPTAFLINTARGALIQGEQLIKALFEPQ